jgi:hypothetical protein
MRVVDGGRLPDLATMGDGQLTYLKWDFAESRERSRGPTTEKESLRFERGKRYAFMVGFCSAGPERNFTLSNRNLAARPDPPSMFGAGDNYAGGWGLRREGKGTNPPLKIPGDKPPEDSDKARQLRDESTFPPGDARFALTPTCEGYPDIDTYRDHEFYMIAE